MFSQEIGGHLSRALIGPVLGSIQIGKGRVAGSNHSAKACLQVPLP